MLPTIQSRYERRIQRFKEKCLGDNRIYFFRHNGINRDQTISVKNLIQTMYPNLDFTIVAVADNDTTFDIQWGDDRIKNYSLNLSRDNYFLSFQNEIREWQRIFNDLGLLVDNKVPIELIAEKYVQKLCKKVYFAGKFQIKCELSTA